MDKETYDKKVLANEAKRNPPILINGYIDNVTNSGDLICSYLSIVSTVISKIIVFVEEYPEKEGLYVVVNISNIENNSNSKIEFPIKTGETKIACNSPINVGDRIKVSVKYDNEKNIPKGIWIVASN